MPTAYIYSKKPGGEANTANFEARDLSSDEQELNAAVKAAGKGASVGGALAGAATGAAAGSAVPVIGTAIGAGLGAGVSLLFGDPNRVLVHNILKRMVLSKWGKKRATDGPKGVTLTQGAYPAEQVLQVVKDLNTGLARSSGDTYDVSEARQFNRRMVVRQEPPSLRSRSAEGNRLGGDEYIVKFRTPEPESQVQETLTSPGTVETLADSPILTVGASLATVVSVFIAARSL
jgi:hypothetical protein